MNSLTRPGSRTPIFPVPPLSPTSLSVCDSLLFSLFLSSDTVERVEYLLTSFAAASVSPRAQLHVTALYFSFFPSLSSLFVVNAARPENEHAL